MSRSSGIGRRPLGMRRGVGCRFGSFVGSVACKGQRRKRYSLPETAVPEENQPADKTQEHS
jgi:hypothetical protein